MTPIWMVGCLHWPHRRQAGSHGMAQCSRAALYLWEVNQPFGLRSRAENQARERAAYPVGAASAAKQAPRWMAPASPVFAAEAAPTGSPPNQ